MPGHAIIVDASGPIFSTPFSVASYFPHDAVAGADARDAVLFGQKRKREFALFGFDGLAAQLNELPLGADERPAVFPSGRNGSCSTLRRGPQRRRGPRFSAKSS